MEDVIATSKLTKIYGRVRAVDGISLHVKKGEIYGFLGLNGAGKTTTIRMLLGMVKPFSGESFLFGKRVSSRSHELWNRVGYLVEIPYSYPDLTVRENLEIVRRLRSLPVSSDLIIGKMKLEPYRNILVKNLSLGNAQRLGLAKALMHDPDLLILDEPANGLDPAGIVEIREFLRELALTKGVTIFISSHILGEISRFADRIGIIHGGKLIQELDSGQMQNLLLKRLLVRARDMEALKSKLAGAGYVFQTAPNGTLEIQDEKAVSRPDEIASMLVNAGLPPTMLAVEEEDLESYFLRTIGMKP